MAKQHYQRPVTHDVQIDHEGKTCRGYYSIDRGVMTVTYLGGGSESTQTGELGKFHPASLAEVLLAELVIKADRERS